MGQGVHTVALQVAAQELGIDPARIDVIVDTTRQLGFGQTTGSRGTLMAAGAVQQACAAALADGCRPDVDYHGEHVVDWTRQARRSGPPERRRSTPRSATPPSWRSIDRRLGQGRAGRRRPRRRQGGQPAAVRGPDRGQRAHGPRLRADRGLPDRSGDRLPDVLDAAPARHPAGQGRARDRGRSSSRCPSRGRRTASRASARSASCPPPRPSPPPSTTSTASGAAPCRCANRRAPASPYGPAGALRSAVRTALTSSSVEVVPSCACSST